MPIALSTRNFKTEIMRYGRLAIVQFRTEWSGTCQIIDRMYNELSKSYKGQADFFSVDVDKERTLHDEYMIHELPTILFFRNGDIVDHVSGLVSKNKLIAKIENALAT